MTTKPIPSPPAYPLIGHAGTGVIDPTNSQSSFRLLRDKYGEIYSLNFFGRTVVNVSSQRLVNELCDEKRFQKKVEGSVLEVVRNGVGDGLFTAYHGEENWGIAHRVLMPAFGPSQIIGMFPAMLDINSQLLLKWERFGPDEAFDPTEDFTRLAFDTIALCAMSYRFNSFYHQDMPPFIGAMVRFLIESGMQMQRLNIVQSWMTNTKQQYEADIKLMTDVCDQIVSYRKAHPTEGKKDLLSLMLEGKDPKTGRGLTDTNIRNQLITFLIAGHETTSGLLSFTLYHLLSNPSAYATLQREIDTVLGKEAITVHHLPKLEYTNAVLRESIRLNPPAGAIGVAPIADSEIIGGEYELRKGWNCVIHMDTLHRDPAVWGEDAEEFRPERMLGEKFDQLPPNSWKPFGNGARACIGRPLAWQESLMMLATLFQRFDIRFDDPSYHLKIKQTLTTKPLGFRIHAIPRQGARPVAGPGAAAGAPVTPVHAAAEKPQVLVGKGTPLHIFFGSNSGSCEGFAQQVASDAATHGFAAAIATLDSIEDVSALPRDGPVIVITASYEGQPADNAAHFVQSLSDLAPANAPLKGVRYAVFGAGNKDWARTYQKIPRFVDVRLEELGAQRLVPRGEGDAGGADLFGSFDAWEKALWPVLGKAFDQAPSTAATIEQEDDLVVSVTGTARIVRLRQPDLGQGRCVENRILTPPGAPEKRHIEFHLPEAMEYRPGDYLAILPLNPAESVHRVLRRFNLLGETKVAIQSKGPTTLPTDEPISLQELFSEYVELGQPMTQRNVDDVMRYAPKNGPEREALDQVVKNCKTEIFDKRMSALELLELHPCLEVPLGQFIKLLPSMRIRQYSISSSPLWKADHCTLTISVVRSPSASGAGEFVGVASNYLATLKPGDTVSLAVRPSAVSFHLPSEVSKPIVMFCAGSGFAPMRGFIQDRAEQIGAGRQVGKALLFVGCRDPEEDFLYRDSDLAGWMECGAVDVRPVFSRHPDLSDGCKYVQDRVWKDRTDIRALYDEGARFYTCGMSGMSNGVRQKCIEIIADSERGPWDLEKSEQLFQKIAIERYSIDVFG
ncbi:fatty acid hydroxylase [Calocera viscosa TUFC12733]|uniref:Fatty acid hydroxylase n=1 Tax=Calocera viscosa (strain TUFC12733) TaxID=1330018 RepID=A0A167NHZ0_CALVF|nr:fatty acid hydroxylase [Calocera viscosa TUFC12733]